MQHSKEKPAQKSNLKAQSRSHSKYKRKPKAAKNESSQAKEVLDKAFLSEVKEIFNKYLEGEGWTGHFHRSLA